MSLAPSIIPENGKFFKISELAGNRWTNVTEDQIYEWHDANLTPSYSFLETFRESIAKVWPDDKLPVSVLDAIEYCWFEKGYVNSLIYEMKELWPYEVMPNGVIETIRKSWLENYPSENNQLGYLPADYMKKIRPDRRLQDFMAYWVFFPEFICFRGERTGKSKMVDYGTRYGAYFNSCFQVSTPLSIGFSHNREGAIKCNVFFDESGYRRNPLWFDEEKKDWISCTMEIKKEDLLIKASSVHLLEKIYPEINCAEYRDNKEDAISSGIEQPKKNHRTQKKADNKIEKTNLTIIGALIELLKTGSSFKSNADIIKEITEERYENVHGLSKTNLEQRFAIATKALLSSQD